MLWVGAAMEITYFGITCSQRIPNAGPSSDVEIALFRQKWRRGFCWSEPLKWHTKIGHSFRERNHKWRERDTPGNFSEWPSSAWRLVKMRVGPLPSIFYFCVDSCY